MSGVERIHVLIVDDNRPMRVLARSLLRAAGLRRTFEANDPAEAFDILKSTPIDLVLTDFAMSPLNGVEFCRMLRQSSDSPNPYVPIIIMTGHSERSRVAAARDAGVTSFLVKPISARSLIHHTNAAIMDARPFIRSATYFGPDRRIHRDLSYPGPFRRESDKDQETLGI